MHVQPIRISNGKNSAIGYVEDEKGNKYVAFFEFTCPYCKVTNRYPIIRKFVKCGSCNKKFGV